MISHYIIMSSSYSRGTRICIDITGSKSFDTVYISAIKKKIRQECGEDVSLSSHSIFAKKESWDSVVEADPFFEGVEVIKDVKEFIKLINNDRELLGIDVAKYILTKISCSHLKLQKLVYLCFAEYISKTGLKLFKDKIYAFKRGPVVESVYDLFKYSGCKDIKDQVKYDKKIKSSENKEIERNKEMRMPQESRILFSKNGIDKLVSIDDTLKKYGTFAANKLVDITHRENTPWFHKYKENAMFVEISPDDIKKYHYAEQ